MATKKRLGERAYNQARAKGREGVRGVIEGINAQLAYPDMSRATRAEILARQGTAAADIQAAFEEIDGIATETDTIIRRLERKLARFREMLTGKNGAAPQESDLEGLRNEYDD